MSRLYISDLKSILNGKLVRFSLGANNSNSLISLKTINNARYEFRNTRNAILEDIKNDFNNLRGNKIENDVNVSVNPVKLFDKDCLDMTIPTILGDTHCLLSSDGIVSSSSVTRDLENKLTVIMPYVKKLFEVRKHSRLLENEFYNDTDIMNLDTRVLTLSGAGIFLPFKDYTEINDYDLQDLLSYYYSNIGKILKNILVNNDELLELYKPDITKEKVLEIYKGK